LDEPLPNSYVWIERWSQHMDVPAVCAIRAVPESMRFMHGALKNVLSGATTVAHHDPVPAGVCETSLPIRLARIHWAHSLKLGRRPDSEPFPTYGPLVEESHRAARADTPWVIHLAEGTDSLAAAELTRLADMGCLSPNTVLVHGVGLTG